ncbi:hypothetical protein XA68_13648 [Ophiocordyceps unilateralis]|uniref:Uncharacterized protein n=1 Tax=Ophiocordyceps unilateralis TaxID=268505 RepID=A0A2A9PNH4_OPHUN|nr:hypothetical protein XA68_13648 [Ophiocordyceps unilateralis]
MEEEQATNRNVTSPPCPESQVSPVTRTNPIITTPQLDPPRAQSLTNQATFPCPSLPIDKTEIHLFPSPSCFRQPRGKSPPVITIQQTESHNTRSQIWSDALKYAKPSTWQKL